MPQNNIVPLIHTIGTAIPPFKISQETHHAILESANGMSREEKLRMRKIYSKSGIKYRHSVLDEFDGEDVPQNKIFHPAGDITTSVSLRMGIYEKYAADLCKQAVLCCMEDLPELKREEITHVITFSCTGMYAPGLDVELVEKLGLQKNVERTCINFMGCYAGINALKNAYHTARSQPDAVILLAGVELCSLHYQKSNEQDQVIANALFSDGAAAAIVSARNFNKKEKKPALALQHFYTEFDNAGITDMVWRIGDFGFDLRLSPDVPHVVQDNIAALVQKLLEKADLTQAEIDHYAIHPGGMKILEACEQALGLSHEQNEISYNILSEYGNMSSVTILFVLQAYIQNLSNTDKGQKILACAFGPGLTMESMIVETVI
ncbi:MAG: type III polyketide synthase [Taibaiella sp.]|nr:type III polyketide synthase [Taibaiella sp.]